jgi:hypothetical protein
VSGDDETIARFLMISARHVLQHFLKRRKFYCRHLTEDSKLLAWIREIGRYACQRALYIQRYGASFLVGFFSFIKPTTTNIYFKEKSIMGNYVVANISRRRFL